MLSNTYFAKDNENDFHKAHKLNVNKFVSEYKFKNDLIFTYEIIEIIIKSITKIKISPSPGEDDIHNTFLENLPYVNKVLACLVNRSVNNGIPNEWKVVQVVIDFIIISIISYVKIRSFLNLYSLTNCYSINILYNFNKLENYDFEEHF